ncbi:waprin-Phi1-like [Periplaneta americana]|uniref:waprin-Phi1-like n=1 Tax=Periplaneta americana TaxID=6978 RepID=UPI0037E8915B
MARRILAILLLCFVVACIFAQQASRKNLICPPPVSANVCNMTCFNDNQCSDGLKCCRTSCKGTMCVLGVTPRRNNRVKPGKCPEKPTGPWTCTYTCSVDGDCSGRNKCCTNRCGVLTCTKPEA